jgi:hypothetical protein
MKLNKKKVIDWMLKSKSYSQVGIFYNDNGGMFIIYTDKSKENFYITGDEFNWERGWKWTQGRIVTKPASGVQIIDANVVLTIDETIAALLQLKNYYGV